MKYSNLHTKSTKTIKDDGSVNARLLQQGGFIDQVMAGAYTFLPLGLRVLTKIEGIIRREMNTIGAEVLMPAVVPTELWERTGRIETVDVLGQVTAANDAARAKNDSRYIISPTHEEVVTPLAQKFISSFKDLPAAYYQIQTKFRNEPRAKSGLLRCREFRMKDLYSFHASDADFKKYYEHAKEVYWNVYQKLGIAQDTVMALASGGDFTKEYSHEFQLLVESGEDTVYRDKKTNVWYNKEVLPVKPEEAEEAYEAKSACEIGNIFTLGSKFSDAFDFTFTESDGSQKSIQMGCYGIGSSRIMGVMVEKYHDERGIIWPASVAPFTIHLVGLDLHDEATLAKAEGIYADLSARFPGEVLFDDRVAVRAGEKFADADLTGCPVRVVVSKRTGETLEVKERSKKDASQMTIEDLVRAYSTLS